MIVTLTDFDYSEYLGVMKGVIYSIYKKAKIIDLYNKIRPQNIKQGAWILYKNFEYFPKKSIFLCVIDPGVGSQRNCIAIKTKNYYFVGPDNGLMYKAASEDRIKITVKLSEKGASKTFHGRDVFAKAAARLEKGEKIEKLGNKINKIRKFEFYSKNRVGEVVHIDYFGNIITNLADLKKNNYKIVIDNKTKNINYYQIYNEAKPNKLFLIKGSSDTLEVSLKNGDASKKLKLNIGDRIKLA